MHSIEQEMLAAVRAVNDRLARGDDTRAWTRAVMESLDRIGTEHGYRARWTRDPDTSEWLWDLCWLKTGDNWHGFAGAAMVCEVEWDRELQPQLDDFLKLAVADADHRLFVTAVMDNDEWIERRFAELKDATVAFPDKRFLVVGVPRWEPTGGVRHIAWKTG